MAFSSLDEVVEYLKKNKKKFNEMYGVTSMGLFGSFVSGDQTLNSDIDMVVEMEKGKKNIHTFLQLKRLLEKEISRKVDLGFEQSLKPVIRDKIKNQIIYV